MVFIFLSLFFQISVAQNLVVTTELLEKLNQTILLNEKQTIENLNLERKLVYSPRNFVLSNPYMPRTTKTLDSKDQTVEAQGLKDHKVLANGKARFFHQKTVHEWAKRTPADVRDQEVCAFKFVDSKKQKYVLESFSNAETAISEGYTITHQYHCGACSSLKDLSVYLSTPNLTEPARQCSRNLSLTRSKACYMREIGFSETCAEVWAYNSQNTRKTCLDVCVKDYGLMNLIRGEFPDESANPNGSLRPCIQCDELRSVPAWRYTAGRSRRGSGITTDIPRNPNEMYFIDYRELYRALNLAVPAQ